MTEAAAILIQVILIDLSSKTEADSVSLQITEEVERKSIHKWLECSLVREEMATEA